MYIVEYDHGKRANLLSDYTFAIRDREENLAPIAKAYCGLKDREIEEMTQYFKGIAMEEHGRTFFVEPKVVVKVKFREVLYMRWAMHSGFHASNGYDGTCQWMR